MFKFGWDPEIDTPATIAVIGAGPCGVEAAIYARFLGYSVELYDTYKVGDSLLPWGDRSMRSAWRELASNLGLAAIEAHEHPLPDLDRVPTYREYVETYLLPLARNDLLYSTVHVHTPVQSISRLGCGEGETLSLERYAEQEFRLLLSSSQRGQFSQVVDIVLDCSGNQSVRRSLATGGGIPIGWRELSTRVHQGRRRILDRERDEFIGKRVLLVGNDAAAAANALDLYELSKGHQTQFFWMMPKRLEQNSPLLDCDHNNGPLNQDEIAQAESIYREADDNTVVPLSAWGVEAIQEADSQLIVTLQTTEDETVDLRVDTIINCSRATARSSYEHNLNLNSVTDSPVVTHEPHFYRLGQRAAPERTDTKNLYRLMRGQIRELFGLIGGRKELDLYQTVRPQSLTVD